MRINPILASDSYKVSHHRIYPKGLSNMYSYFESRGEKPVVLFGLRYLLEEYFTIRITTEMIDQAEAVCFAHFGYDGVFNRAGWEYIRDKHQGRLPLRIKALPEGTVVPGRTPMITVEVTDPKCAWLTNYMETLLSHVWYGSTIATNSREIMQDLIGFWERTSDAPAESLLFKVHDFGFRGVSGFEQAAVGGAAHLTQFRGTDTMSALTFLLDYYEASNIPGFSIPATEHSIMTLEGPAGEPAAMRRLLEEFPTGIIACVSDSYDIERAIRQHWGDELRELVLSRDGVLVVRPDSGDPIVSTAKVIQALWDTFGGTVNSKGFKVLDPHVRMIQGDGIDREMIYQILTRFERLGFSIDNIAFGSGGGLLQKFNRDTYKFAFKCSEATIDNRTYPVQKFPMEYDSQGTYAPSFKYSKAGRFPTVVDIHGNTISLMTVYENGRVDANSNTLDRIRERCSVLPQVAAETA